jgi:hypothetical protein
MWLLTPDTENPVTEEAAFAVIEGGEEALAKKKHVHKTPARAGGCVIAVMNLAACKDPNTFRIGCVGASAVAVAAALGLSH